MSKCICECHDNGEYDRHCFACMKPKTKITIELTEDQARTAMNILTQSKYDPPQSAEQRKSNIFTTRIVSKIWEALYADKLTS